MMFTEGLDERAIDWVKQGVDTDQQLRPPLTENFEKEFTPQKPLLFGRNNNLSSPHVLPPLKFYSSLLTRHSDVHFDSEDDDIESIASASCAMDLCYSDTFEEDGLGSSDSDLFDKPKVRDCVQELSESQSCEGSNQESTSGSECRKKSSSLVRGALENLRIEVPANVRRYTDTELGFKSCQEGDMVSHALPDSLDHSMRGNITQLQDLGTPSAPPVGDIGNEESELVEDCETWIKPTSIAQELMKENYEMHQSNEAVAYYGNSEVQMEMGAQLHKSDVPDNRSLSAKEEVQMPLWKTSVISQATCYNTRLCLNAWARDCMEAPEFLRDECIVLRNAFGLHRFLLHPRHQSLKEGQPSEHKESICGMKAKKVGRKITVEAVRKIRIIPQRPLRAANSQRGLAYMQVGADYVRHASALLKTSINSLKLTALSVASEESLSCLLQLRSSNEETTGESSSVVFLRAGSGDSHVFFPESQSDALLVDVQDKNRITQGRAIIDVSSLSDNPNDRVRWWPIYHDDHECIGKIQLSINSIDTSSDISFVKSGPVVETLVYDLVLEAAMCAQHFHTRNLRIYGAWKWLLTEFADYYGVSDAYTKLRYLSYILNVATPTKDCLDLVHELLLPVVKARGENCLTRQEKSLFLDCEAQVENLLASTFENYKSLDENSPTGITELYGPNFGAAAPALVPTVQIYCLLHDILSKEAQTKLRNYFQIGAARRCRKHMVDTDEFMSSNNEDFLSDPMIISTAYLKMKTLCINISNEIQADIKIHNQHILPSQVHGGVDSRDLFHGYIMVWVQDKRLYLLDLCKAEKVPWTGVSTQHCTSPFVDKMYDQIRDALKEYQVVINRWPQYSITLENATADVEQAILKALEKQYADVLTPLKESFPQMLEKQVQKLTRRQSTSIYVVPSEMGMFLNTVKRIIDILHCTVEDILKTWAACLPVDGDKKVAFGEQLNGVTVMLKTRYKNYMNAIVEKLMRNVQANRTTRLKKLLQETTEAEGEAEMRENMQPLCSQLMESIQNLHDVFSRNIFVAITRGFWDRMGQIVLTFLGSRKENKIWYKGSWYALGILDDVFASQMQRLLGNALDEKDLEPPRSVTEARSILCRDTRNSADPSNYFYV
ncbi:hypothetical protein QJS10_CPB17g00329 [Acorus calamus]|uniref:Uncharacterized protein n=1 Tax=Acorus calamus TaxID=4465 RepID=A0AAV9CWS1_ACOCL|nr:hypothetical protein QJS10_CPB17g00329 [Acorus calamus]